MELPVNLTTGDVHVLRPVGTDRKLFARKMENEWTNRMKQRKKKTKKPGYTPDWVAKMDSDIQKKFHSASNRRKLAAQGKALPNESYPIEDTEDLKNAATLARSGHGDVNAAKRLISRRAKQLGVSNPLASSSSVGKSRQEFVPIASVFARLTESGDGL